MNIKEVSRGRILRSWKNTIITRVHAIMSTMHGTTSPNSSCMFDVVQEDKIPKDDSRDPLYGIASDIPKESYNLYIDVSFR